MEFPVAYFSSTSPVLKEGAQGSNVHKVTTPMHYNINSLKIFSVELKIRIICPLG